LNVDVLRIEQIHDPTMLRHAALLLDRENQRLHEKIKTLLAENARLRGEDSTILQHELAFLQELLAQRTRALFGPSSEKRPAAPAMEPAPASRPAQTGHGPRTQPRLPLVDHVHELDEADRQCCPKCGQPLATMTGQFEESEEVTVVERRFVIVRHRRQKYRCQCNGHVETAAPPPRLGAREDARGHRYSVEFAVEVATQKYLDHLPLERQVRIMRREGLDIDSHTLWDQLNALAQVLAPSQAALTHYVLNAELLGADETWWRVMVQPKAKRWWAWTLAREDAVVYRILDSRSHDAARQVLGDYRGIVIADGYGAYDALARGSPGFTLAHCWAHARRKYVEAEPHYPAACQAVLDLIRQLYAVEARVPALPADATAEDRRDVRALRARLRGEQSRGLVREIRDWALGQRVLPESSLGKAISYMLGLWAGLTRFLDDPRIPIDNNHTERGLRGMVVGRKNHYGSRSQRGTEVAALFYSLIESAKLCGVDPKAYLLTAARAALADRAAATLPHALLP
jgi:transposase